MVFSKAELRAWVLDGGTRFVPPQTYDDDGYPEEVSAERQQVTDDDVRRALLMLGAAVDIDLAYCAPLTDAIITEIGSRCPSLKTLDVRCASSPRASPASRARPALSHARLAARAARFPRPTLSALTRAHADPLSLSSETAKS